MRSLFSVQSLGHLFKTALWASVCLQAALISSNAPVFADYIGLDAGSVLNAQMNTLNVQGQHSFIYQPISAGDLGNTDVPPMVQLRFEGQLREKNKLHKDYQVALNDFKQANYNGAIQKTNVILVEHKDYASAYLLRGASYFYQRNFIAARDDASQFIALTTGSDNAYTLFDKAYTLRAASYFMMGQYDRAVVDATQAIKYNPKNAKAFGVRAGSYLLSGDKAKAEADVAQALKLEPDALEGLFSRAIISLSLGKFQDSMTDINAVLSQQANCAICYTVRGYDRLALGDKIQAQIDAQKTLSYGVEFPFTYSLLGHIANQNRQTDDSKKYFERAIQLHAASGDTVRAQRLQSFIDDMTPPDGVTP